VFRKLTNNQFKEVSKMKIKVKEGSSVWKLATYWGLDFLPSDFCSLVRNAVWCFVVTSFIVVTLSFWVSHVLATVAASVSVGYIIWSTSVVVLMVCIGFVLLAIACALTENFLSNNPNEKLNNAKIIYHSWKDKFCPLVEEEKQ
jgi:hypothetical protein